MKLPSLLFILLLISISSCHQNTHQDLSDYLSPAHLPMLKHSKMIQVSSYDRKGGNNDRINIHSGKTAEILNVEGPGIISRIWITIDSRDPHFLRRILFRMYWDNETTPSVEVPIGDFFGSGFKYIHHTPQLIGMSSGGYYSYFPMPFNKKARIEVVNQTGEEIYAFYYQIDYQKLEEKLPSETAYFHAQWNRDSRTTSEDNYTVLEAKGEGHFVGLHFNGQSYNRSLFYLEGDEMIYVDDEEVPSIQGTGLEDYFTSGWYFKDGPFDADYHGLVLMDSLGRVTAYRHHILDPIPFKKNLKVTLEHGHGNEQKVDFSTTAFWYQMEPHRAFEPILDPGLRIPLQRPVPNGAIEAEGLEVFPKNSGKSADMSTYGSDWSKNRQLEVSLDDNDHFSISIPNTLEKEYDLDIYTSLAPQYGEFQLSYNSKILAEFNNYHPVVKAADPIRLKGIKPKDKKIKLDFKLLNRNDSNETKIGIDAFVLIPKREYIPQWYAIGPFDNLRESDDLRYGLDSIYAPELEIDLRKTYIGSNGQEVRWKKIDGKAGGYGMGIWNLYDPYEFIISYYLTYVYSPKEQTLPMLIGSDDGAKVFLNNEQMYRFLAVRIAAPDQDSIQLPLKKGWNKLLIKAENNFGGYAFYARIIDIENNLSYSTDKSLKNE